jgi:hypothetical protein
MQNLLSWWDSYQALSTIGTILKCLAALLGILILLFSFRESSLRGKAQAAERTRFMQRIDVAEASARPRTISSKQKEAIIGRLKALPQRQKIHILASVLDAEAMSFAEGIEGLFLAAGFEVHLPKELRDDASLMVGPPGLHIAVKDPKSPNPLAAKIQRTFMDSGIEILGLTSGNSQLETNGIEITVGQK